MTTEPDDLNDLDENDENDDAGEGNDLRNLRRKARNADRLEKENAALAAQTRKLAFYEAGLTAEDLTSPVGELFSEAYKGELNSEAITAAWAKVSGVVAPAPAGSDEPTPEEQEVHRQRQSLGGGAVGDTGETPPDPVRGPEGRAVKAGQALRQAGRTREEAQAATFRELVDAATTGDQSVILPFGGQREE